MGAIISQMYKQKHGVWRWPGWTAEPRAGWETPSTVTFLPPSGTVFTSRPQAHLQHKWKTLSGLPSDSDFTWTISHTVFASASRQIKPSINQGMFPRDPLTFLQKHLPRFGARPHRVEQHRTKGR